LSLFLLITAILSAIALGYMATIITGRWANMLRLILVALAIANAIAAAKGLGA